MYVCMYWWMRVVVYLQCAAQDHEGCSSHGWELEPHWWFDQVRGGFYTQKSEKHWRQNLHTFCLNSYTNTINIIIYNKPLNFNILSTLNFQQYVLIMFALKFCKNILETIIVSICLFICLVVNLWKWFHVDTLFF